MKKSLGAKTLAYPTPAWVIGSYDKDGKPNVMTVAWGGICCSKPPAVTISLRKATYSFASLVERKAYTVNIFSGKYVAEVDYYGIASGRDHNKFEETKLTPIGSELVDAPYVDEAELVLECKIIHIHEIGLHTQFIGEIIDLKADESILDESGKPLIEKLNPIIYAPGASGYYSVGPRLGDGYSSGMVFKGKSEEK